MNIRKSFKSALVAVSALVVGTAHATAPDYTTLTAAVDFSGVATAAMAIGALAAAFYIVPKGVRLVIRMIKGA